MSFCHSVHDFTVRVPAFLHQHRLMGGAIVLALTQFGASLAGLFRDNLLARTFPGLGVVDVYVASFRPSDLLFQICIMSALGTVFVPILAAHKAHGRRSEIDQVLTGTMAMGGAFFGLIALGLGLGFPWIAGYLVSFTGTDLALYIRFGQMALLTNFLFVFGNAFGQYLITEQRYWMYGITPILYTLGTIAGTLWLTPFYGVYGPMMGTVAGAVALVIIRATAVFHYGFRIPKKIWHPDLHNMGILMLPRMFALGALQLQLLLFDTIASGLDRGSITINAYARNFQSVLVGIAGIALAQSAYSLMSQAAARGEAKRFKIYVEKGLGIMLLMLIPASILLMALAPVAARLVHLQDDTWYPVFRTALILYAISASFESASHLLLRGFYAYKDTVTPAIIVVSSAFLSVGIAWFFTARLAVFSLPLGYSLGQILQAVILGILLMWKINTKSRMPATPSPVLP
ncbi:MAG: hypothetical protein HOO67_02130 [Candidatus Peribacteraceae bacterium]|nr:hypothetical protein [Candidatus Peribacteraceae bacterium]